LTTIDGRVYSPPQYAESNEFAYSAGSEEGVIKLNPRGPVALIGTLDTKGEELKFLRDHLRSLGVESIVIDIGILGKTPFTPDVTREQIASYGGDTLEVMIARRDRGTAVLAMQRGLAKWLRERHAEQPIAGVLGIGGSGGTSIASAGMRELPLGVPKLMVSTSASGNVRSYVGGSDILMMHAVADIAGLNRVTCDILATAANAMAGMCSLPAPSFVADRPLLCATMFGVTTPCVSQVRAMAEAAGYELLVFSANGVGGQSMEQIVRTGLVQGVIDITTTELADELAGGILSAGPDRLEEAGKLGVPQVISVGAIDMVNFGTYDTVPEKYRERKLYRHNSSVTLMRTTPTENAALGKQIAQKASGAVGPVTIVLPLRGVSAIDCPEQPFYDREADEALFDAIRRNVKPQVKLVELDAHINDALFAERLFSEFLEIAEEKKNA
jgi:uncharacterized protein (UPF0261 family)